MVVVVAIIGVIAAISVVSISGHLGTFRVKSWDREKIQIAVDSFYSRYVDDIGRVHSLYYFFPIGDNKGFEDGVFP